MTCKHVSFASKIPKSVQQFKCLMFRAMREVEIEEISDFLAKEEAPLLFLYSSSDTLIKPAAVEEYIKTCTRNKLSFQYVPVVSSSLMLFMFHLVRYFTPVGPVGLWSNQWLVFRFNIYDSIWNPIVTIVYEAKGKRAANASRDHSTCVTSRSISNLGRKDTQALHRWGDDWMKRH